MNRSGKDGVYLLMARVLVAMGMVWMLTHASAARADLPVEYEARVTGPAFREPIWVISTNAVTLLHRLGVRPSSQPTIGSEPASGQPLGPRYEVRHVLRPLCAGVEGCPPHEFAVTQYLYPHAAGRLWVFTPPGQRFWSYAAGGEFVVRPGWWGQRTCVASWGGSVPTRK